MNDSITPELRSAFEQPKEPASKASNIRHQNQESLMMLKETNLSFSKDLKYDFSSQSRSSKNNSLEAKHRQADGRQQTSTFSNLSN